MFFNFFLYFLYFFFFDPQFSREWKKMQKFSPRGTRRFRPLWRKSQRWRTANHGLFASGLSQGCCSKAATSAMSEWVGLLKNRYVWKWESFLPRSFHPPFCSLRALSLSLPFSLLWFIHVVAVVVVDVGGRCTAIHARAIPNKVNKTK